MCLCGFDAQESETLFFSPGTHLPLGCCQAGVMGLLSAGDRITLINGVQAKNASILNRVS